MAATDESFAWFKPIRNRIRKYEPLSLIIECSKVLHEVKEIPLVKMKHYTPWSLLQIIKWTVIYGEPINYGLKTATRNDVHIILNQIRDLENHVTMPSEYSDVQTFLKALSYQQFWLQQPPDQSFYGRERQIISLDVRQNIQKRFYNAAGLQLSDFLDLAMLLSFYYLSHPNGWVEEWFVRDLKPAPDPNTIRTFFSLLSRSRVDLKAFLRTQDERVRRFDLRLYEQSPLKFYPLLSVEKRYMCYSPTVLHWALSSFIYDFLKANDPGGFSGEFGELFEGYVQLGLSETGAQFFTESDIQSIIGRGSKSVDFVLPSTDAIVLIESKGIEMPVYAAVSSDRKVVDKALEDSMLKALKQAYVTTHGLRHATTAHPATGIRSTIHVLVVTYKSLYIGKGADFVRGDIERVLREFCIQNGIDIGLIPFSRIHFLSAREFEGLVAVMKAGTNLNDFLLGVERTNSMRESEKFDFGQHLPNLTLPEIVRKPFTDAVESLQSRLRR